MPIPPQSEKDAVTEELQRLWSDGSSAESLQRIITKSNFSPTDIDNRYNIRKRCWPVLFRNDFEGRVIDLTNGYGHVANIISHLAQQSVFASNSRHSLIVAAQHANRNNTNLDIVQASTAQIPFDYHTFDSVIIDCRTTTGEGIDALRTIEPKKFLTEDGVLFATADTSTRALKTLAGEYPLSDQDIPNTSDSVRRLVTQSTPAFIRSLRRQGFDAIDTYALFPGVGFPEYIFSLDDSDNVFNWLSSHDVPYAELFERIGHQSAIKFLLPDLLFVCAGRDSYLPQPTEDLLIMGNHRTVGLQFDDKSISTVRKIPLERRCEQFNIQDNRIRKNLREQNIHPNALPESSVSEGPIGTELIEYPIDGTPVSELVNSDEYERIITRVVDWLIGLHTATLTKIDHRDTGTVRSDLTFEPLNLTPGTVQSAEVPVATIHGDFQPKNIYVEDGEIQYVTDWEYAKKECNSIIDIASFVIYFATNRYSDFQKGFENAFVRQCHFSDVISNQVERYCSQLGISKSCFIQYLSMPYLHYLRTHQAAGTFTYYVDAVYHSKQYKYIWKRYPDIQSRFVI